MSDLLPVASQPLWCCCLSSASFLCNEYVWSVFNSSYLILHSPSLRHISLFVTLIAGVCASFYYFSATNSVCSTS